MSLLRRNRQIVVDKGRGDCFRASLTSVLGIPNDPALIPDAGDPDMFLKIYQFLRRFGLSIRYELTACWSDGLWIASVPSKNFEGSTHAIVMDGTEVAHDPTTTPNAYAPGTSLLGKEGAVRGGWNLEVTDPSLLSLLVELQRAAPPT